LNRRRTLGAAAVALGVPAAWAAARVMRPSVRPGHPFFAGAPLLIAHRGGALLAPENTLLAFGRAVEWWHCDILELDVHATRDGEVVVIHDDAVDRTTDGDGRVASLALDQVLGLDAGYRFTPDGGRTFPFRDRGVRIPTFREVLQALPNTRLNVEIKDARAQQRVWEVVREARAAHRVLIAAGRKRNGSRFSAYPGPRSASSEEMHRFYLLHRAGLSALFRSTVDAFQMPEEARGRRVLTRRLIDQVHAHNLAVHVWTVNEEADMRRLLEWEVDGIMTDRPDVLARVLHGAVGRPLPPGPPEGEAEPFMERLLRPGT
jgi:glycerophosphoryl diester phosphodiesterase